MSALPDGGSRLALSRALLSGLATAALLPDLVRTHGGDAATCLHLGALFAVGTLASELPSALLVDRESEPRAWLSRAGIVQSIGLFGMVLSRDLPMLAASVVVVGLGAGMCTGAEARASVAIGGDARTVARLEVFSALGKAAACLAIALIASISGLSSRATILVSIAVTLLGSLLARGLPDGTVTSGRRCEPRDAGDRRRAWSLGPISLVLGVAALTLVARGTDPLDAFASGGLLASAALLSGKGLVARAIAPSLAHARLHGAALAAVLAAIPLALAVRLPTPWVLPIIALACGVAGGAAAAARGVLLTRLGSHRVGTVAALEATVRRVALASTALLLAPALRTHGWIGPYAVAGTIALIGAMAVVTPGAVRTLSLVRN